MTWYTGAHVLHNWDSFRHNTRVYFISTKNDSNNVRTCLWGTFIEGTLFPHHFNRAILVNMLTDGYDPSGLRIYQSLAKVFLDHNEVLENFNIPERIIADSGLCR